MIKAKKFNVVQFGQSDWKPWAERINDYWGHCSKCGATLIRGPSVSVCENWWCESLPEITAPAASLEAWEGL